MRLLETAQGSLGDRSAHSLWANTGAYSRMQLSLALGETQACVMELQQGSSSKLPGYEPVTGASSGMSVPWSVCVMPGEVRCGNRGSSKCFQYAGPGSHDPVDYKRPAMVHNEKAQMGVQREVHPSPTAVAAEAVGSEQGRCCHLLAPGSG